MNVTIMNVTRNYLFPFCMTMSMQVTILLLMTLQITSVRWLQIIILRHPIFWTTPYTLIWWSAKDSSLRIWHFLEMNTVMPKWSSYSSMPRNTLLLTICFGAYGESSRVM
ncbi:uncharacterized protein LOC120118260 [Hibiscus syriacus]|uniref:uncharacterized protein LOC120118260 n=1 Tax=Hibiscus syriacus TaxID=106335 RepID=UPI001920F207|nr:uncharacterized protein LOC120118260 [Hibiscus syriacus]